MTYHGPSAIKAPEKSCRHGGMTDLAQRPLHGTVFYWLVAAMFTVTLGYGVLLPVLPFLLERLLNHPSEAAISYHTGWLMGTFMFALFVFAPLWGHVSDRIGRRTVIMVGLGGGMQNGPHLREVLATSGAADVAPILIAHNPDKARIDLLGVGKITIM
jgi:MFS family permease